MNHTLEIFEERYAQAIDFPPTAQPGSWRTWEKELVESNVSKHYNDLAIAPGQLFRFEENRPDEGYTRHVGRVTPFGIYIIIRDQQGLRAITSQALMSHVKAGISSNPLADPIHHILVNF